METHLPRRAAHSQDIAPVIGAASRTLIAAMMGKVAGCGFRDMTPAFASLIPLLDGDGERPSVLARRAGITKQAISQLVRELEARGYVEQVADPADTRAKLVRLTRRGVALRATCSEIRVKIHNAVLRSLGAARVARLHRDLTQLTAVLAQMATPLRSGE
jgi:DNA-binding MarR family transcriptional regulator